MQQADAPAGGRLAHAARLGERATRREGAAGRRLAGLRHRAGNGGEAAARAGQGRQRRQQALRVGMARRTEEILAQAFLDQAAGMSLPA